ncbi:hypothetical protein LIA77_11478 [Sarocladium implicatum]|nr:hypothetical protein LIA77_11478 [Sarocladium implicatum]
MTWAHSSAAGCVTHHTDGRVLCVHCTTTNLASDSSPPSCNMATVIGLFSSSSLALRPSEATLLPVDSAPNRREPCCTPPSRMALSGTGFKATRHVPRST